jgi:hypothetical protein
MACDEGNTHLATDLDRFLADLCIQWGFCNGLSGARLTRDHPVLTGEDFATAVLAAERMHPETEIAWRRKIARRFTDRYGDAVSSQNFRGDR